MLLGKSAFLRKIYIYLHLYTLFCYCHSIEYFTEKMFFCHFGSLSADEFHGKHYFCTVKENILKKTHTRIIP